MVGLFFEKYVQATISEIKESSLFLGAVTEFPIAGLKTANYSVYWNIQKETVVARMVGITDKITDYDVLFTAARGENKESVPVVLEAKMLNHRKLRKTGDVTYGDAVSQSTITRKLTPLADVLNVNKFIYGLVGPRDIILSPKRAFITSFEQRGGLVIGVPSTQEEFLKGVEMTVKRHNIPIRE